MNALINSLPSSKRFWSLLGVLLFVVFSLRAVPPSWGAYLLTRGTGLAMSGLTGNFWHGRAALASINVDDRAHPMGWLDWEFKLLSVFTLKPCVHLKSALQAQEFEGDVCVGGGLLRVQNADLSMPASLVQNRLPIPVDGELMAQIQQLDLRGNVLLKLDGKLKWVSAQVNNGASWMDLGNYGADLSDNGYNGVKAHVYQLGGPVDVNLNLELTAPSGGSVKGELAMTKDFVEATKASGLLDMIAQEKETDDQGKTHYLVDMNL